MAVTDRIDLFLRSQAKATYNFSIDVSRIYFYESSLEPWGLKDLNSRYIYVNTPYLELLNQPEDTNIVGRTFEEVVGQTDEFSAQIRRHELQVIQDQRASYSREIRVFGKNNKVTPYIFKRMPYFTGRKSVSALEFNGIPWPKLAIINSKNESFEDEIITSSITLPTDIFSERDWTIIYLYCSGMTRKLVAKKLNISEERVKMCLKSGIETMNNELQIDTKNGIVPAVIYMGWLNHTPIQILSENHSYTIFTTPN